MRFKLFFRTCRLRTEAVGEPMTEANKQELEVQTQLFFQREREEAASTKIRRKSRNQPLQPRTASLDWLRAVHNALTGTFGLGF